MQLQTDMVAVKNVLYKPRPLSKITILIYIVWTTMWPTTII